MNNIRESGIAPQGSLFKTRPFKGNLSISYDANSDVAPYETLEEAGWNARGWAAPWRGVVPSDRPNEFLCRCISAFDALSEVFGRMSAAKE